MKSAEHPNVLWICTDQQRADTIHALGNPVIRTPSLDLLVDRGIAFTNAYCQAPACTPSRASFLTGCYPSTIHACINGNEDFSDAAKLAGRHFADYDYHCGLVGKLHISAADGRVSSRADDGYHEFAWSHAPRDLWGKDNENAVWLLDHGLSLADLREQPGEVPSSLHQTTWCADRASRFIRDNRHKLSVYHGHGTGELYDLFADPNEQANLWDDPRCIDVKLRLMKLSFDALAHSIDTGPPRIGYY